MQAHHLKIKALTAMASLSLAASAQAADLSVVASGGFAQAYKDLSAPYEKASGDRLVSAWGPSMGTTKNAIPARLARGARLVSVVFAMSASIACSSL